MLPHLDREGTPGFVLEKPKESCLGGHLTGRENKLGVSLILCKICITILEHLNDFELAQTSLVEPELGTAQPPPVLVHLLFLSTSF